VTDSPRSPHPAKRSLGQNFLEDPNTARKIVAALRPEPGDRILEIGPGRGALTRWLAEAAPAVLAAVEKDAHLARELRRAFPTVHAVNADALEFAWEGLGPRPWKLVGNLPYNVASPIMWEAAHRVPVLQRAVFMVQKEVGRRLAAAPGTSEYGALSVWIQSFVTVRFSFIVKPTVFRPRPKVDSAVVVFEPAQVEGFDSNALSLLLKLCFQRRRKQLRVILREHWNEDLERWFTEQGVSPTARPDELSPRRFHTLAAALNLRFAS